MQDRLERVEDLGAGAQPVGEARRAHRHHHELLEVHLVVGVRAAVQHVHHRHRQHVRRLAAEVAPQRHARPRRPRPWPRPATRRGSRWRRAAPCSACRRARSSRGPAPAWSVASRPRHALGDLAVHVRHRLAHALAVPALAAVAQLDRLELAGGRARGHRGAPGAPEASTTSTSTVGLPRLSRICRACTAWISLTRASSTCSRCTRPRGCAQAQLRVAPAPRARCTAASSSPIAGASSRRSGRRVPRALARLSDLLPCGVERRGQRSRAGGRSGRRPAPRRA